MADWKNISPEQLTLDDIKRDNRGKRRKGHEKLEMQAFHQIAKSLDEASIKRQMKYGVTQQDITHHLLRVKALDDIGIGETLTFVLSGATWNKFHPIVKKIGKILRSKRDELKMMGINLTCAKNASDNAYLGSLLRIFDLRTTAPADCPKQETINGERVRNYRLCPEDLKLTKEDLVARLPRNQERFEGLSVNHEENQWVREIYKLHIPSENNKK